MPIAARSAPNNGRVKEAKVSSCTRGTDKTLNGKVKRDDKTNVDRRANGNKRRDIREDIRQAKRGNENENIIGKLEEVEGSITLGYGR